MMMLKKWSLRLFAILFVFFLMFTAWLLWIDESLANKVRAGDHRIDSPESLNDLPFFVTKPLQQMLRLESVRETVDPSIMVLVAQEYVRRKPMDVQGWLWKSLFHQRDNDVSAAKGALDYAHNLSKRNIKKLSRVFNRYLELNAIEEAMPVARDLSFAHPKRFRSSFYLMARLHDDYDEVVARVIPSQPPVTTGNREPHDLALYYNWALSDAIRAKNVELADAVWNAIPADLRMYSEFGRRYIDFLSRTQNAKRFKQVWLEHSGEELVVGRLPEQVFFEGNRSCWYVRPVKTEAALAKSFSYKGTLGLTVNFTGKSNLNYAHATCTFIVEAEKKYVLRGRWKGEGITTLSGPFFDVYAPSVKGFYKKGEPKIGSWPWSRFEIEFSVPRDASLLTLRLRRAATDYLDSKISGTVSFANIELELNRHDSSTIDSKKEKIDLPGQVK